MIECLSRIREPLSSTSALQTKEREGGEEERRKGGSEPGRNLVASFDTVWTPSTVTASGLFQDTKGSAGVVAQEV